MYVLNELTMKIVEDIEFAAAIQDYLLGQREQFGISRNFIDALEVLKPLYQGRMFELTKIIGMDMVYRARVEDRRRGIMTLEAEQAQIDGLRLNIQEASITDKNAGYADNAMVGAVLAKIPPTAVTLTHDPSHVMLFHLSRRWTSLYETWNLAFCLGNLAYMSVLLPKLLAPAVIDAPAERFLITRSAALWLSTLFHQFATLKKRENVAVPHARELAQLWECHQSEIRGRACRSGRLPRAAVLREHARCDHGPDHGGHEEFHDGHSAFGRRPSAPEAVYA